LEQLPKQFKAAEVREIRGLKGKRPSEIFAAITRWIEGGIASGERYDGPWFNVGSPADLAALDRYLTP